MAPTKNIPRLSQKVVKKRAIRPKPAKPPLKNPACNKVKIASLGSKPPKIERKVTRQRKIELANEVALEQLTNASDPLIVMPAPIVPVTFKTEPESTLQIKKMPTLKLKRKLTEKTQEDETPAKKPAQQNVCKPKRGRKSTVKAVQPVIEYKSPPKPKPVNIQSDSEPESFQVILKRPGPKSMTMNLPTSARTETSVNLNKKTVKAVTKAKSGPGRTCQQKVPDYFSDAIANETPKTVVKRVTQRKPKKPEIEDTKRVAAQPKRRPRSKFVAERKNGNNSTVTRSKGKVLNVKEIKSAATILDNALKEPARVQARSNSVNSAISNLSWTRDISTASSLSETTTCFTVCSTDFVRFDKKIPLVQLENNIEQYKSLETERNVDEKKLEDSSSSDSESESSESSSDSELNDSISKPELNLSTSSLSKSPGPDNTELLCLEMDKLTNSLKNFYTEMDKWLAFDDDTDSFSTILEAMNLEKDVISSCENFSSIIGNVALKYGPDKENSHEVENLKAIEALNERDPHREKFPTNISNPTTPNDSPRKWTKSASSESFTSDNYNYVSFDDRVDDGDTLSLYAESIIGIASSRRSSVSNIGDPSIQEPYVKSIQAQQTYVVGYEPKPTRPFVSERYSYQPTRIEKLPKRMDEVPLKTIEPKMVEKQNADSSSIKDTDLSKKAMNLLEDANRLSALAKDCLKSEEQLNKPQRIFSRYQSVNAVKSALYRGQCFFHIASQCKNIINCRFPHVDVDKIDTNMLMCRLEVLSEDSLIEEYLLTVKYRSLRRKFGLLFMKECARRESTRLLLEMSIDLGLGVVERDDQNLNVEALETTLLHLNSISFDECEDLLTFEYNNIMLCDALLLRMAYSQNFSQFKRAFVKLTHFMSQRKRPIDIETVGNILERVCILPCEDSIARGILCLMKNTDARIFENNMTKSFESQLSSAESDVYESYLFAKKEAMEFMLDLEKNPTASDQSPISHVGREGPRHPSPDTTNLDSLKKAQMAQPTTFKRTINMDAIRHPFKSPTNPAPKQRYLAQSQRQWQRGSGYAQPPTGLLNNRKIYRNPTNHRNGAST